MKLASKMNGATHHNKLPMMLTFFCGSGILPRGYLGWKPLPQKMDFITE